MQRGKDVKCNFFEVDYFSVIKWEGTPRTDRYTYSLAWQVSQLQMLLMELEYPHVKIELIIELRLNIVTFCRLLLST